MLTEPTATADVVNGWPYDFQSITDTDPLYDYLGIYATAVSEIDSHVNDVYDQRYLDTATGPELANLGAAVGVTREAGESDERFRFRITLAKTAAASDGTAEDIAAIFTQAFDEETLAATTFTRQATQPVVDVRIPAPGLASIPLSDTAFESLLEDAFPCGYGVRIIPSGTFLLGESGDRGLGEGKLL